MTGRFGVGHAQSRTFSPSDGDPPPRRPLLSWLSQMALIVAWRPMLWSPRDGRPTVPGFPERCYHWHTSRGQGFS